MSAGCLIFDKYEVVKRLAVGGMGEIFLARQVGIAGFDRLVILKSLLPDLATRPDFVNQFLDEARVAAKLHHHNIVGIYEVGHWDGSYSIAMEYVHGADLATLLQRSTERDEKLPLSAIVDVIRAAAAGLDHAHRACDVGGAPLQIVHRDVSPQNIMVTTDGVTKVVDFGIARAATRMTRTQTGFIKGKLAYMAPEQLAQTQVDGRADQYALGAVLWELGTGRRMIQAQNEIDAYRTALEHVPRPPSELRPEIPPELDAIVMRMLARDPSKRFPSMREVEQELDACSERLHAGHHEMLGQLVTRLAGDLLEERTSEARSSQKNFSVQLTPAPQSTIQLDSAELVPADIPEPSVPEPRRFHRAVPMVVGFLAAVIVGLLVARRTSSHDDTPAAPQVTTPQAPAAATPPLQDKPLAQATAAGAQVEPTPGETSTPPSADSAQPKTRPKPRRVEREPVVSDATTPGYLSVDTQPPTQVSVDGQVRGTTPLYKVPLPPGPHRVVFRNPERGIEEERPITIRTGDITKLSVDLSR